ncbi:MAG: serine/threonine-protein kinase, partial [Spirulinaceae cyanobacterium]
MTSTLLNNRYRLLKPLGEGGFGNTFLAEDTHMPSGRRCVIKQLKPVTNDPQYYQLVKDRFGREAATLEKLGQGNNQIPNLYAYFSEADQFYLVQEWIEGETLTKLVEKQGKLGESQVKELLTSLLPVLAYIHSQRIVHRDIKPDNIIIRTLDNQPVLIDFGAVKEAMGTVVNSQGNATNSIVIGTPGFMPSEQAAGRPVYASDLYGLGLVAVYCLTGKMPQELVNDPQTGELLWQEYAPQISPQLARVLNKAIMSHPRDRFSDAQEMLAALQSNLDNAPTIAVAPGNRNPVSQAEFSPTVAVSAPSSQTVTVPKRKSGLAGSILLGSIIM